MRIARRRANDNTWVSKGFAYVDFTTLEAATSACEFANVIDLQGKRIVAALSDPPKRQQSESTCTAFLNNLPFQLSDDDIKAAFPAQSDILSIRIVRGDNGSCKGFAYVEFTSEEAFAAATEAFKENPFIRGRKVQYSKADPTKDRRRDEENLKKIGGSGGKAHKFTVFLKNLGYKVRESELMDFFADTLIESIVIAKDEKGMPKGFGFVSFRDHESLKTALAKGKGTIRGKEFEVLKYDKPVPQR